MRGKIVIEITRRRELPDSLALPDMGHVAAFVQKEISGLKWTDANGKPWRVGDAWDVTSVRVEAS